ncbi:heterokaryon incompatibility protein Het-C-domain-containing protein [Bisporella sp. PMI_857]|nr:heterokaryon incompatibility protein Het-C-domain-containing protein [Bisporella sp. PMI_857]
MGSQTSFGSLVLTACLVLLILPSPAAAFGAGNIPSISTIEGQNFRHGDIEDMLKTIAFIKGHKWTSMMVKRVYFGNWLRDYSQAVDVGSLKGVNAATIRILLLVFWLLLEEFEVTEERLGVYRPEEHIDNPKGYADDKDARDYDSRLRGPVSQVELEFSLERSIHFGRLYTNGSGHHKGKEADLCEALRCLGQGLHCLEDFGAHTNYVELTLRELGYHDVFPHTGASTEMTIRGRRLYPLVTGTFGAVDFLHSVLGEATDHFTQTEVEEMDLALLNAEKLQGQNDGKRGLFGSGNDFASLIGQVPGLGGGLADSARELQTRSAAQEYQNSTTRSSIKTSFQGPPGSQGGPPGPGIPGMSPDFDPDRVVKAISSTIAKIPGLEALVDKISETLTVFILSLLAPFVRPIIDAVSKSLKEGSTGVVEASANSQFEPWNDPYCTNPTHSMLSKDHFSNKLNGVAGRVATTILQYTCIYAWENPGVPIQEIMRDIVRVFHHPALRDEHLELHRNMFNTVKKWVEEQPDRNSLNHVLSSASVKAGRNHAGGEKSRDMHDHGSLGGHGKTSDSLQGDDGNPNKAYLSSPQPGSPAFPAQDFGYGNNSSYRPNSRGGHLNPEQQFGGYQGGPPPSSYQQQYNSSYGQEPPSFGMPPGPPEFQQQSYSQGQPPYSGYQGEGNYYQQGPPPPTDWQHGHPPPGNWQQGPPPGEWQQGPPQPPYPDYPPQQPPHQPPHGGYPGGGYPGSGYHGSGY